MVHVRQSASGSPATTELGAWRVFNDKQATPVDRLAVRQGDAIDFIVTAGGNPSSDAFGWSPTVIAEDQAPEAEDRDRSGPAAAGWRWSAARDFGPPPAPLLSPWEQVAQALLLTNEFWFLD